MRSLTVDGVLAQSRVVLRLTDGAYLRLGLPETYRFTDGSTCAAPHDVTVWTFDPARTEVRCAEHEIADGAYTARFRAFDDEADSGRVNLEATLRRSDERGSGIALAAFSPCLALDSSEAFAQAGNYDELVARMFVTGPNGTERLWRFPRQPDLDGQFSFQWYVTDDAARAGLEEHPWGVCDTLLEVPFIGTNKADSHLSIATTWQGANVVGQGPLDCLHCEPDTSSLPPGQERTWRGAVWASEANFDAITEEARRLLESWGA